MSNNLDLDTQFSPSMWCKKNPGLQRIEEHIKTIENYSQIVLQYIPNNSNIPYGPGKREVVDIYGTDLPEESPLFIYIHGGYWQHGICTHNNSSFIAKNLYSNNIKSIFIGYELCPNVQLANLIENIQKAIKMCLNLVQTSKTRGIYLGGHSAGAQIISILFKSFIPSLPEEQKVLFKSAFLISGIYDLIPLIQTSYNIALKLDIESAISASPIHQKLKVNQCHMVIVVAEDDCPKFKEQGEMMYQYVKDLGFQSKYLLLNNIDHFDIIENLYNNENELTKLIIDYCINK